MQLSTESVLTVIGAGSAVATAIFWGSFYLGKLTGRIDQAHERIDDHDEKIGDLYARRRGDHPTGAWDHR